MAAMVQRRISTLNPDAPVFDPVAFREVEDFSPEWWELVRTSKWFRDFWLSENSEGDFADCGEVSDVEELIMSLEEAEKNRSEDELMNDLVKDVKALFSVLKIRESPSGRCDRMMVSSSKFYQTKPTKYTNPNFRCRRNHHIYQPR